MRVGCMFKWYSLDKPDLLLAGYDKAEYRTVIGTVMIRNWKDIILRNHKNPYMNYCKWRQMGESGELFFI